VVRREEPDAIAYKLLQINGQRCIQAGIKVPLVTSWAVTLADPLRSTVMGQDNAQGTVQEIACRHTQNLVAAAAADSCSHYPVWLPPVVASVFPAWRV
jgi:uncharacterized protein